MARFLGALLLALAPHLATAQDAVPPLATPGIRATFGDAETFMEMVRTQYAVVYRPRSVAFDAPLVIHGELVQPVRLTDAEGRAWLALYPMQRQPDGSWRTNGCLLERFAGTRT